MSTGLSTRGEIVFVKIIFAWTEDRALRGRNLSADPRLEAMGRVSRDALPFLLVRSPWDASQTLLLAQCVKSKPSMCTFGLFLLSRLDSRIS